MVSAQLHSSIDALNRSNTVSVDADCLVDHGDQDTVDNETGGLLHLYGGLADILGNLLDGLLPSPVGVFRPAMTSTSFITGAGIEEMHTDDWDDPALHRAR